MIIIGIDPGLDGAVFKRELTDNTFHFFDTPTLEIRTGKKKKREYNIALMADYLKKWSYDDNVIVVLEKIHSMPGQGVRSMFSMGEGYGIWKGIVTTLGYQLHLVTPQSWKKVVMAGMGKEKDASRQKALQLYPQLSEELKLKKHHGRADALLMVEYHLKALNLKEQKAD